MYVLHFEITFLGKGHQWLYVTFDGIVVGKFPRTEALKAYCLQFATLYNYGVNYEVTATKKTLPGIRDWFNFNTIKFWDIRIFDISKCDGVSMKKKAITSPIFKPAMELSKKIFGDESEN